MLNKLTLLITFVLFLNCQSYSQFKSERLWMEKAKLVAPKPKPGDAFGCSVSIYKTRAIISSPRTHSDGLGRVYVFEYDIEKDRWIEQAILVSDTPYEHFGQSVCLHKNIAVIGAWGMEVVYVFRYSKKNRSWVKEAKLKVPDVSPDIYFGYSVAVYNHTIVIGAPRDNTKGNAVGAVYAFNYHPQQKSWKYHSKLIASNGYTGDIFGNCVSLDKDTVLIGAHGKSVNGYSSGAAYVFQRNKKGLWKQKTMLIAADNEIADFFGYSVSIHQETLIIGANGEDSKGEGTGAAYIFCYDAKKKSWMEKAKLHCSDVKQNDFFGNAVHIHSNTAIIGAYGKNKKSGAAYVFENTNGSWVEKAKLTSSDAKYGDRFGKALAIYENNIIVSARCLEFNKHLSGVAYLFAKGLQK